MAFPKVYSKKKDGTPTGDGRRANCRICENARRKKSYQNNIVTRLLMNSKARARLQGWEHNLEVKDVVIPEFCPILEVPFIIGTKDNYDYTPTIDRIDSSKGYIKGNVKVISMRANKIKTNASQKELETFSKNISNYFN